MERSAPYRPFDSDSRQAADASDNSDRCPYLGIPAGVDPSLVHPSDANQCLRAGLPIPISTIHQENYCFSSRYESCPVYRAHETRPAAGGGLLPLTALGVASTSPAAAWPAPPAPAAPAVDVAAEPAVAAGLVAGKAATAAKKPGLMFPWEEPAHPDFQADIAAATARRHERRLDIRPVIIGLVLLALIPVVWWAWTSIRSGSRAAGEASGGAVVTLPTAVAIGSAGDSTGEGGNVPGSPPGDTTSPGDGDASGIAVGPAATPSPTGPEATATLSDLEKIAITATALFVNATAAPECAAPAWWVSYLVEEGDTIDALAVARGITPEEMIAANCLVGPDLTPGMMLLLPPVGLIAIQPVQPTATPPPPTTTRRPPAGATPTRVTRPPTRVPVPFPTFTFPIVIVTSTPQPQATDPSDVPTDAPEGQPTSRPTTAPTSGAPATATPPNPFITATPPNPFATATPPKPAGTSTPPTFATMTPPGFGGTATVTVTPTRGGATSTPPTP